MWTSLFNSESKNNFSIVIYGGGGGGGGGGGWGGVGWLVILSTKKSESCIPKRFCSNAPVPPQD